MFKIFILEDNINRIEWFKTEFKTHECDIVSNVKDGLKCINSNTYDVLFLDHDLDNMIFVDSHLQNTGYQLATLIPESLNKDTFVIVHSMNPVGADNILTRVNGIHMPFGTFTESVLEVVDPGKYHGI